MSPRAGAAGGQGRALADDAPLADEAVPRPVVNERTLFEGRVFDLVQRTVDLGAPGVVTRELLRHPGAVAVVALDEADRVLLIRQYRVPVGAYLWEIPAGLLDGGAGETLLVAAQRELREEADVEARQWDVLVDVATTPGASSEVLRVYLARGVAAAPAALEGFRREGEEAEIMVRWVDLDDAVAAVLAGRLHNPSACVGLLAAARAREAGFAGLRSVTAPLPLRPGSVPA